MTGDPRVALREGPITVFQIIVIGICTVLNMIDGFNVLSMSFTVSTVQKEWNLDTTTVSLLLSSGLLGMCLGSFSISPIADVIGRRAVVLFAVATLSIGMLASAWTGDVWQLMICRVVTGLGVGAMLAGGNTLLAEYSPDRWRDLAISAMVVGYSIGAILGGWITTDLIHAFGWRSAFLFGGICSTVVFPFALYYVPESIDFLLSGRSKNALARVNRVMGRLGRPALPSLPMGLASDRSNYFQVVAGIFQPRFIKGTVLICLSFFMLMLSFYFVLSWTPKNIEDLGFTKNQGIYGSLLLNLGGIIGGLIFGYFAGKSNARRLSPYMLALLFVSIVAYGALHAGFVPVMSGAFVAGFFMIASMTSLYAIVPMIYPPQLRNTGTGMAIGFGRLGAIIGPILGGVLIGAGWQRLAYYSVLAIPVLVSAVSVSSIPLLAESAGKQRGEPSLRPAE